MRVSMALTPRDAKRVVRAAALLSSLVKEIELNNMIAPRAKRSKKDSNKERSGGK